MSGRMPAPKAIDGFDDLLRECFVMLSQVSQLCGGQRAQDNVPLPTMWSIIEA